MKDLKWRIFKTSKSVLRIYKDLKSKDVAIKTKILHVTLHLTGPFHNWQ
jgi:hypothetical protein